MNSLTSAVGAVITDDAGRVLLCQQPHGHRLWGLPGGRIRPGESPVHAAVRDIREETGSETEIVDLVGLYQLTGGDDDRPDVLTHVFRGHLRAPEVAVNSPRVGRLAWYDPAALPEPLTATTRTAVTDAVHGAAGVLRTVQRDAEPEPPDADDAAPPTAQVSAAQVAAGHLPASQGAPAGP